MARQVLIERAIVAHPVGTLVEGVSSPGYIVESANGRLVVKLPVTVLDKKNENGRTYGRTVMEGSIRNGSEAFKERRLTSTVDGHPSEPYVEPGNASHVVLSAWCEGGYMWNEWEILGTAKGKDLAALIESKIAFGVSIRGLGSVDNYGNILEDYEFLGTDCVGNPSARIWTTPEVTNSADSNAFRESVEKRGSAMNLAEISRYVKEQTILVGADKSIVERVARVSAVESAIAAASISPREMAGLIAQWDTVKESALKVDQSDKDAVIAKLEAQVKTLQATARKSLTESANKTRKTESLLQDRVKKLTTRVTQLVSEKAVTEARNAKLVAANRKLVKEHNRANAKLRVAVQEAAKAGVKAKIAVTMVAEERAKTIIAVKEAAVARKAGSGKVVVESGASKKPLVESSVVRRRDPVDGTMHVSEKRVKNAPIGGNPAHPAWL